ncbi:MAG: winged helix-turn-helix transcriptional regulator [Myxococcales bacterium]|nr:winged helix-turn-helix transcriptional regulator [Myxococcales bacterium]
MTDATIGETLHRLLHAYKRALRQAYEQGQISLAVSHIRALESVASLEDCTAQAIVARTHLDKAQITRALNDLAAEGLIEKRENPGDRRSNLIVLSRAGRALVTKIRKLESQAGAQMAEGLGPDELADFVRLARRMLDNLTE